MRTESGGPGAGWGADTGCRSPGLQESGARWGRGRRQRAGAQGSALSKALNQERAGRPSPPCTPGGRGTGRSGDCCGYRHRLPKVSGHGGRVLGRSPQAIEGRGSWGVQPWPDPFSWEASRTLRSPTWPPQGPQDWTRSSGGAHSRSPAQGRTGSPPGSGLTGCACRDRGRGSG